MNKPVVMALVALLCYGWFTLRLLQTRDGDISRFVVAGAAVDEKHVPPGLTVRKDIGGYDGVAFYRLAIDPFTSTRTAYGITLDRPAYRQQRILYPLLAHFASFGRVEWIPAALVAVNFAALVVLAAAGASLARQFGVHAAWGLLPAFYPGFLMTLSRDTSEIVAAMFAAGTIRAIQSRRFVAAAALLSCAILTRETMLIVAIAAATAALRKALPWFIGVIPVCILAAWQTFLFLRWRDLPLHAFPGIHFTLDTYVDLLVRSSSLRNLARLYFSEGLYFALLFVLVIAAWRSSPATPETRFAWIGFCALVVMLPRDSWNEDASFMRTMSEYATFSLLIIVGGGRAPRIFASVCTGALWVFAATHMIRYG